MAIFPVCQPWRGTPKPMVQRCPPAHNFPAQDMSFTQGACPVRVLLRNTEPTVWIRAGAENLSMFSVNQSLHIRTSGMLHGSMGGALQAIARPSAWCKITHIDVFCSHSWHRCIVCVMQCWRRSCTSMQQQTQHGGAGTAPAALFWSLRQMCYAHMPNFLSVISPEKRGKTSVVSSRFPLCRRQTRLRLRVLFILSCKCLEHVHSAYTHNLHKKARNLLHGKSTQHSLQLLRHGTSNDACAPSPPTQPPGLPYPSGTPRRDRPEAPRPGTPSQFCLGHRHSLYPS